MNAIKRLALILTVIGGINWLVYGLMERNLVSMILSQDLSKIVYIVVGIAAIISLTFSGTRRRLEEARFDYFNYWRDQLTVSRSDGS